MRQPTTFGKYLLLERIAVGGMAEVFVAKAFGVEGFERLLAIKKILPTMGEDAEFISMFVDEARIAVQLAHPNIVQVLELGKNDDTLFIAMEYISGRDLRQLIERFRKRQKPLPLAQAAYIVKEVCAALDHAHRKCDAQGRPLGIVHRDVSPQNVLVSFEGQVKLIDFGIAKAESRLQKTQAGILKGKFSYMSPEQVKGQPVDGRSDIFACGILLWELVCGEKLFTGDSDYAVLDKVRMGLVPPPRSRNPLVPPGLEKVILKALATDPARRYQSAWELHDELVRFTSAGDAVFGSRQLASWLLDEFKEEAETERKRLRTWLAAGRPPDGLPPVIVADLAQTPADPFPAHAPAQPHGAAHAHGHAPPQLHAAAHAQPHAAAHAQPHAAAHAQPQVARPPEPRRDSELPTLQLDEKSLASAENDRFDLSAERTVAPRQQRASALSRPVGPPSRRWALYAATPVALGLVGISWVVRTATDRAPPPAKLIITPSPSIDAADLLIDGRPAGELPPFVHTLAPGKHRIEIRAPGYKPFSASVDMKPAADPLKLRAELEPEPPMRLEGVVLVQPPAQPPKEAPAHARPDVPRQPKLHANQRPAPGPTARPGSDRMKVAGVTGAVAQTGTPTPSPPQLGYLVVKTTPAARLTVDGRDLGRWTPVPPANPIALPAGPHTLLLVSADGRKLEEQVQIVAGETSRLVRALP